MKSFFKLSENGTNFKTEVLAGITTFFAMAYIIAVNPGLLSQAGMPWGAVFLATIISSIIGTLIMGLFANVPYAQAPGMGLNAFFVFTVCFNLKFTWQQALSMVFLCGLINILITVTNVRKYIIKAIPNSLQNAIGAGIGVFIAYIGFLNAGLINFGAGVPSLSVFNEPRMLLFLFGLFFVFILLILKVKGAIFISIVVTTIVGIPFGLTQLGDTVSFTSALNELPKTFGVIFSNQGLMSLFNDVSKLPLVLITILSFSLSDTFDTIGTFIGTGRRSGIFSKEDEEAMANSRGIKTKMDKALCADAVATSIGAIFGTSNTTTYVESAAGIGVGGRTGLVSVVVAILFALSAFFANFVSAIPSSATAPALVAVGCMMVASFADIEWTNLEEAIPCFFAGLFMSLCYSISYGIGTGFIFYCLVKILKKEYSEINPILLISSLLFIVNFVLLVFI